MLTAAAAVVPECSEPPFGVLMRGDMGLSSGAGLTVAWARSGASGWLGDLGLTVLACGFTRGTGSVNKPDMTEASLIRKLVISRVSPKASLPMSIVLSCNKCCSSYSKSSGLYLQKETGNT